MSFVKSSDGTLGKAQIVLVGTISNVASHLESELGRISRALSDHNLTNIILVESDSADETISITEALAILDTRIELITLGKLKTSIPDRIERIRHCRQVYVERLREIQKTRRIDFVVVADLDGMNSRISKKDINLSIESEGWDAALANQWLGYYDLLALRHPVWMPGNCFEEYYRAREKSLSVRKFANFVGAFHSYYLADQLKARYVYSKMIKIPRSAEAIEVDSGFGGFGIYKAQVFLDCDYAINSEIFYGECEHISLSRQMREDGYKIYIHPWLINSVWNTYNVNKFSVIRHIRALRRLIKSLKESFDSFSNRP